MHNNGCDIHSCMRLIQVPRFQSLHGSRKVVQRTSNKSISSTSNLSGSMGNHTGQHKANGNRQHSHSNEYILEGCNKLRLLVTNRADCYQVASSIKSQDEQ